MRYYWHKAQDNWEFCSDKNYAKYVKKIDSFCTIQDFDKSKKAHIVPLYFDLDNVNLDIALIDARKLYNTLKKYTDTVYVYFSGSKGFHIIVPEQVFGATEFLTDNTKYIKHMAGMLAAEADIRSFDKVVYTSKRMLRLVNSQHSFTNNYKVQLSEAMLFSGMDIIMQFANKPRRTFTLDIDKSDLLQQLFEEAKLEVERLSNSEQVSSFKFNAEVPPVCVQYLLHEGWQVEGYRNQTTMHLSCFLRDANVPIDEAKRVLGDWTEKFYPIRKKWVLRQKRRNAEGVVSYVYDNKDVVFTCAAIRSVGGAEVVVPCQYETCAALVGSDEEAEEETKHIFLQDLASPVNVYKKVTVDVMVVGTRHNAYVVPKRFSARCYGGDNCKNKACALFGQSSEVITDLSSNIETLLYMCNATKSRVQQMLATEMHVSGGCTAFTTEVLQFVDIHELVVIPKADTMLDDNNEYALKKIFAIGNLSISENKYYRLTGLVYPHPLNQMDTMAVLTAVPLQNELDKFVLTASLHDKILTYIKRDTIEDTINNLVSVVASSISGIYDRENEILAMLLTYASALHINVPWDNSYIRGWVETIIVGDTGTGKSALISKFMQYIKLGSEINAEASTRTGITYKLEQVNGSWFITWGSWVRADKELLWIDECSEIPKTEYSQMTLARSSGKLSVKRAVTAETPCRVRLIATGNVPEGGTLSDFSRGVLSLKQMFNTEDIRRFDLGLFLRSEDVSEDIYSLSSINEGPSQIPADIFRALLLNAWTIKPENIIITNEVATKIKEVSMYLSKLFGAATDIPLISPSDQRNKIARLSTALALLTYNMKDDFLIVSEAHVEYIKEYLETIYKGSSAGLLDYAKSLNKSQSLTKDQYDRANALFVQHVEALGVDNIRNIVMQFFINAQVFTTKNIEDNTPLTRDESKQLIVLLVKIGFVTMVKQRYKKTIRFNSFIELYQIDNDIFEDWLS